MAEITKGSEKQISWAKAIKTELSENFTTEKGQAYVAEELEDNLMDSEEEFDFAKLEKFIKEVNTRDDAKWFIDNRNITFFDFEDE